MKKLFGTPRLRLLFALLALCAALMAVTAWLALHPAKPAAFVNGRDGTVLLLVPGGPFIKGSDGGDEDERPSHTVVIPDFYIGRCEVTNAQFGRFVTESRYTPQGFWEDYAGAGKERNPVVGITYQDALAYCRWAQVRLPTESEWEKASRGSDGRKWPWGNAWDKNRCNNGLMERPDLQKFRTVVRGGIGPMPVGMFPEGASPCGALDMAGNVWEWCSDLYAPYPGSAYKVKENEKGFRVIRGGSWDNDPPDCLRGCNRLRFMPDRSFVIGFRVARDAPKSTAVRLFDADSVAPAARERSIASREAAR